MLTALVNGQRSAPFPGLKGVCPGCGQPATPKCGEQLAWHWSHKGRKHCDPWWENETDWHRAWKACFNINWQEVVQSDSATDEIHIADVKTPKGVVLEFQNSPMDLQEMRSRESFYRNMVWIVNASSFHKHLEIGKVRLPPPSAPFLSDVLLAAPVGFFRPSTFTPGISLQHLHRMEEIQSEIDAHHIGHFNLGWKRAREVWIAATCPVFLDTGYSLLELAKYPCRSQQLGVRAVQFHDFIKQHGGEISPLMNTTRGWVAG